MWLLDSSLGSGCLEQRPQTSSSSSPIPDRQVGSRLAAALATCAQLSSLAAAQRMWSLQTLRRLMVISPAMSQFSLAISQVIGSVVGSGSMTASGVLTNLGGGATGGSSTSSLGVEAVPMDGASASATGSSILTNQALAATAAAAAAAMSPQRPLGFLEGGGGGYVGALSVLIKGLPEMLLRQFEYEDPIVRGGKHLLHSSFFKELVALACDLGLDALLCATSGEGVGSSTPASYKWTWFKRYCTAARVASALISRLDLPQVSSSSCECLTKTKIAINRLG